MGTVPASLSTYLAVLAFKPDIVISAGTAGGFKSQVSSPKHSVRAGFQVLCSMLVRKRPSRIHMRCELLPTQLYQHIYRWRWSKALSMHASSHLGSLHEDKAWALRPY